MVQKEEVIEVGKSSNTEIFHILFSFEQPASVSFAYPDLTALLREERFLIFSFL